MSKQKLGKYFYIRSQLNTDLVLEVESATDKPGISVVTGELVKDLNNDHQLWYIDQNSSTIRTKINSFCVDLRDDMVLVNPYQRGKSTQRWLFYEDTISNQDDFELILGILDNNPEPGAQVVAGSRDETQGQLWSCDHRPAKFFYIRSDEHEKVMDVRKDDPKPGAKVILYADKGKMADNQLWYEDQTGVIRSKMNNYVFDSSVEKSIVLMPVDPDSQTQQWVVHGNTIMNRLNPDQVLDVKTAKLFADDLVVARDYSGGGGQSWYIDYIPDQGESLNHSGNGKYFFIRNRYNGLVLMVKDVLTPGSTIIGGYPDASMLGQLFYSDQKTGTIRSRISDHCMEVSEGMLVIKPYQNKNKNQQWRVKGRKIQNRNREDLVLQMGDGFDPGEEVTAEKESGEETQSWDIQPLPARSFTIQNKQTSLYMDIEKDNTNPGARVITYKRKEGHNINQMWYEDERGVIRSKMNGYVLDATGDNVKMQPCDPTNQKQQWIMVDDMIQNLRNDKLVLDIDSWNLKNVAKIVAAKHNGTDSQKWIVNYVF